MGGKKKSKKAEPKKRGPKLAIAFTCPSCNADRAVTCKLKHDEKKGVASCGKCKASFETVIKAIHQPIDVYTKWVDECERLNAPEEDEPEEGVAQERGREREEGAEARPAKFRKIGEREREEREHELEDDEAGGGEDYNEEDE